jgi:polyferredoxin
MNENLQNLRKIVAKTFRKAKRWYLTYVSWQFAVLLFAVVSIFTELSPNFCALVAFLGVITSEFVRWRSDWWKSEGERAKRKWEISDGFGTALDGKEIADWLAARSKNFLNDVAADEIQGSLFDSILPEGPRRAIENTQESAWWTSHLCRRMVIYLVVVLISVLIIAFVGLTISIGALKPINVVQSAATVQNIGGIICAVLVFVFSINLVRLLADFWGFKLESTDILSRCEELLKSADITVVDSMRILHDYQTARNAAPLLPTFVWKRHGDHLREQWERFRPKSE